MAEKAKKGTRGSKSRARRTAPKMGRAAAAAVKNADRGSIALRRSTSEYRAAAAEQAAKVREEIEAALVQARSTREAIENRIAEQLHAPPTKSKARTKTKRASRK